MIYTLPFIAAIIGWFTNYIAVKMLFYPRKKIKILFFEIQGIFPKKHLILAEKIGRLVAEDLLSVKDIQEIINQPENISQINKNIERKIEEYLSNTFPSKFPVLSFFMRKKSRHKIKQAVMSELETMGPEMIDQTVSNLESSLDIEEFIRQRVTKFSTERMEKLILSVLAGEFRFIEWTGAILGFIIGLIQVVIIQFF